MRAKDIMTTQVLTVTPDTPVREVAAFLLQHHISGVPVVDSAGRVLGMIGEIDLIHRIAARGERHRSWWQTLIAGPSVDAAEFVKIHGLRAADVMTSDVATTTEDTPVEEIAHTLEARQIRRVPVIRDGKLVGIVSRADLLRVIVAATSEKDGVASVDDRALRDRILAELTQHDWSRAIQLNVSVTSGVAHLNGFTYSEAERQALRVVAEEIPGVRAVENHLTVIPNTMQAGY